MPDEDWVRLEALMRASLRTQSDALSSTFDLMRRENIWDSSLIVVVGDAGASGRPEIPFDEQAGPSEAHLGVPLLIKYPKAAYGGSQVRGMFAPRDVFETVRRGLGLESPIEEGGRISLWPAHAPLELVQGRPHVAYRDARYSTRLGPYLLTGVEGRAPRLCRLDWDPACTQDRSSEEPLVTAMLWERTFEEISGAVSESPLAERKLELDERTRNALFVWGLLE